MKKVVFVSAEVTPYAKSGGLADVAGSLPKELLNLGYDVSVIMPRYKEIPQKLEYVMDFPVKMKGRVETCIVRKQEQKVGKKVLTVYFIDNYYYFDRPGMYCHFDEGERFAFFDKGAAKLIKMMEPDVIHLNDWQSGPIALLMRDKYRNNTAKIIYTIHNLEYNGYFGKEALEWFDLDESYFVPERLEFYGGFSFMKTGILYADMVSTVSRSYAEEIQTEKYGFRYEGILRQKAQANRLIGIVNGIDYEEFDPEKDKCIYKNYNGNDLKGKQENKVQLQKELGLPVKNVPVFSIISRVVQHKGFDLLIESLEELLKKDIQFILLGVGDSHYINRFKVLRQKFPEKVSLNVFFDPNLAKKIYAGSDMFLMPSIFEPCGLSQLISFRYGTIPIVRITGGLKDTVVGYLGDKEKGNGFTFWGSMKSDFINVVSRAIEVYENKSEWETLVKRVMKQDFSWKHSAKEYDKLYQMK